MDHVQALRLRKLVSGRTTAALGTLHSGAPYVSMVPFALLADGGSFVIHVSALAAHTQDMLTDPRVSLLIAEPERAGVPPQALPRATVVGIASQVPLDTPGYEEARRVYLARFPEAAPMFELGDFSLFVIAPSQVRWVAGFAQALSLTPESFAKAVLGGD